MSDAEVSDYRSLPVWMTSSSLICRPLRHGLRTCSATCLYSLGAPKLAPQLDPHGHELCLKPCKFLLGDV